MTMLQTKTDKILIQRGLDDLLGQTKCNQSDKEKIVKAFDFANEAHKGVRRKSGEPYIVHPIAVAQIVVQEMNLGVNAICAALLHDVVEDTDYTLADIEVHFGVNVRTLVDGLTKIEGAFGKETSKQAENFKKILLTMVDDVQVILIKLADRLHNMRTLDAMSPNRQMAIASETLYLFAPLADRMGFFAIKSELEDLSLKYYEPEIYTMVSEKIHQKKAESKNFIADFKSPIVEKLDQSQIHYTITSRFKSVYSTSRKIQLKGIPFEQVYDLFAIRIVFDPTEGVPERTQCWHIYSLITEIYKSKTDRIRDWAGTPKANGYEALHCTLMGPKGVWVEVQIRTRRMDEIAERGLAAHWKYKNQDTEGQLDKWLREVKVSLVNPETNALEFMDQFKITMLSKDIIVFTPKGDSKSLIKGSTVLDFAYEIHTQIGNQAIAGKVNRELKPLNYVLKSGDQIEILTTSNQFPQIEWLEMVHTMKAKNLIKAYLKSEKKDNNTVGRETIEKMLADLGIQPNVRTYRKLVEAYKQTNKEELFSNVGAGLLILDDFDKILRENTPQKWVDYWTMQLGLGSRSQKLANQRKKPTKIINQKKIDKKSTYLLEEEPNSHSLSYEIATCCKPIPGEEVVGFTDEDGVKVIIHKKNCPEASRYAAQYGDRIVNAQWTAHTILSSLGVLEIRGIDRIGILKELTQIITDQLDVNIRKLNIESHDGIFEGTIELYVHDIKDLRELIAQVERIKGMDTVTRLNG